MTEWEYRKIDLNQPPPRWDELDLLNDAGADGWELVGITANNIAYLRRPIEELAKQPDIERDADLSAQSANANGRVGLARGRHEVKVKYRDPKTNETWSGRGRMASWLKSKQDAGEDIQKYLVSSTAA